jgi:hypothetical protein
LERRFPFEARYGNQGAGVVEERLMTEERGPHMPLAGAAARSACALDAEPGKRREAKGAFFKGREAPPVARTVLAGPWGIAEREIGKACRIA